MYKLMTIDDEFWMRKYLRENIDWEALDIQMAGEAEDAEEALEMLSKTYVDIIIVDINMPGMSGIEFSEILLRKFSHIKIILISGYKDFEYARRAVSLGVMDYILKPVEEEKLLSVIRRAVREIDETKAISLKEEKNSQIAGIGLDLLRQKFYSDLVNNKLEISDIKEGLSSLQLDFPRDGIYAVLVSDIDNTKASNSIETELTELKATIAHKVSECLGKLGRTASVDISGTRSAFILEFDPIGEAEEMATDLRIQCENACKSIAEAENHTITMGTGKIVNNLSELHSSYARACSCLESKFYAGTGRVLTEPVDSVKQLRKTIFGKAALDKIAEGMRMSDKTVIGGILSGIRGYLKDNPYIEPDFIKRNAIQFMDDVIHQFVNTGHEGHDSLFEDLDRSLSVYNSETADEVFSVMYEWVNALMERLGQHKRNNTAKIIQDVLEIIRNRFHEGLYLDKVAEEIGVHPSYLCRVYKKETGENLIHYIMNYRIEKAKQLLCDPNIRIYEVATMVGYENIKTFSRIFKNIAGITPKEYREKLFTKN